MDFHEFERVAREAYAAIPPDFREGVDGLDVTRETVPHPTLPEIFTLGECKSEFFPSEFGGAGEVRSVVVLYYGSFLELSRRDEAWDWEGEIWETITHEIRHHLESLAGEEALEELDYAEDQNFARREREPFEPLFFRDGNPVAEGAWEVDGDLFVEVPVGEEEARRGEVAVRLPDGERRLPLPSPLGDVHYVRLPPLAEDGGEAFAVLVRRRGWREWLAGVLRPRPMDVRTSDAPPDPA
jgi:predicted Zn-dependent protease with MMP-like domain